MNINMHKQIHGNFRKKMRIGVPLVILFLCFEGISSAQNQTIVPQAHSVGEIKYVLPKSPTANVQKFQSMAQARIKLAPSQVLVLSPIDLTAWKTEAQRKSFDLKVGVIGKHRPVQFSFPDVS